MTFVDFIHKHEPILRSLSNMLIGVGIGMMLVLLLQEVGF